MSHRRSVPNASAAVSIAHREGAAHHGAFDGESALFGLIGSEIDEPHIAIEIQRGHRDRSHLLDADTQQPCEVGQGGDGIRSRVRVGDRSIDP